MKTNAKTIKEVLLENKELKNLLKLAIYAEIEEGFFELFNELKQIVKIEKFENDVIYISVENSIWKNELFMQKKIMIEKINKYFKSKIIDIKFI